MQVRGQPLTRIALLVPCPSVHMTTDLICVATGRAICLFSSAQPTTFRQGR
jgi:hypothetical protein